MIIMDLNQVMIANLMVQLGNHTNVELQEGLLRHMILNSIRLNKRKFQEYGELVIACDDKNFWRKKIFPYYKAARKKQRNESELDWSRLFEMLNKIRDELKEFFPYVVLQVESAEADDIIASLCKKNGVELMNGGTEKILILSGDKDFVQLQKYANVDQYNPVLKKWVRNKDPHKFIKEHIIKGDRSDGIPNIASSDDTFVSGKRQRPIRQTKINMLLQQPLDEWPSEWQRNWHRNKQLVDLNEVPEEIDQCVMDSWAQQTKKPADRSKLFNYFVSRQLKGLMENINEF